MKLSTMSKAILGSTLLLGATAANAYMIDFTNVDDWGMADGQSSYTFFGSESGIDFSIEISARNMIGMPLTLSTSEDDGLGVRWMFDDNPDEIDYMFPMEFVELSFYNSLGNLASVSIDEIYLLNLDQEDACSLRMSRDKAFVEGSIEDEMTYESGCVISDNMSGDGTYTIGEDWNLPFYADSMLFYGHSYSIAGMKVSGDFISPTGLPIPEPETLGIFGLSLLGLGIARRKRS